LERVSQRDLEALLAFLRGIYGHQGLESFVPYIVSRLSEVVASEWTSFNEVDPQNNKADVLVHPVLPRFSGREEALEVFERYVHEHPLVRYFQQTGDGRALKISDFLAPGRFHETELYNEFFKKIGVEDQIAIILPSPPPLVVGIALNRGKRNFSERDRLVLDLLRSHLVQAYRNAESVTRLEQDSAYVQQAMDELDRGLVVLAKNGRVRLCTDAARRSLSQYFEPAPDADHLPESLERWVQHQRTLASGHGGFPPPREPLVLDRAQHRLVVRFVEDHPEDQDLLLLEDRSSPFSAASLGSLGLTPREVEIVRWISRGKTNKEIATILYISSLTVKKHLEHIYRKLGVEGRTEAVSRALKLLDSAGGA
jgi:DNA-binding CsgD family transcriptional regulator